MEGPREVMSVVTVCQSAVPCTEWWQHRLEHRCLTVPYLGSHIFDVLPDNSTFLDGATARGIHLKSLDFSIAAYIGRHRHFRGSFLTAEREGKHAAFYSLRRQPLTQLSRDEFIVCGPKDKNFNRNFQKKKSITV